MRRLLLLALLTTHAVAGGAATPEAGNGAGDRLIPLVSPPAPNGAAPTQACTADRRWCVLLTEPDEGGAVRPLVRAGNAARTAPPPPAEDSSSEETFGVWPALLPLKDGGFLAGVEVRTGTSYSGGGGSATELRLFHLSANGTAGTEPVLTAPLGASLMIRACFSESDMRRRRGACHDEYGFSGRIALAPGAAAERPALTYRTEAWAFPRGVSRSGDSTTMRPLGRGDLVRQRDARCSFTRRFRFDAAAGAYRPEAPLPDCSDYTVP
ncbi:hypothetical protein [Roseomonas indoligenes]|uniref:Uncharacterized protein n=1 Tax=Roseomonas indoligenes TaxID=2820811 RepID=A0A940N0H4_9PROT|nr:hypothetical protein [Pararoseomonas indoligenes]MBP0493831.1 hypothetical protein [Pararoseomonas indoligenes]